ncbi:bifunctional diguanylate cyclase/phosphodiesterase [Pelagibacterium xiamenense]|uniref:bifunctional diguanylate cyclase/phosphodiesterase n=1 Tax=Pelagibacterium xiamenense TaxID=2901140 RepID=UPI0034E24B6E
MRALFRANNIPAIIALAVTLIAAFFAEYQNRAYFEQSQRSAVLDHLSLVRARLEGKINANIHLVHGLVGTITVEPDMSQERFARLASHVFEQNNQLRNVAAAPDLVVRMVYPLAGNASALGLDYNAHPDQRDTALRARDTGRMILAGPVNLVQGGTGFIARFPVSYRDALGQSHFWGIVAAVIDADALYAQAGLDDRESPFEVAISGPDGTGADGPVFWGDPAILRDNPVTATVELPTGSWLLSAHPTGGWRSMPPNTWQLRLIMAICAALVLIPILLAGRLSEERRRRVIEQRRRELELSRLSRRLELALATSQVGVWEMNIVTGDLSWDDRMNEIYGLPVDGGPRDYSHWRNALHPDDFERAERDFNEAIRSGSRYISNYRVIARSGEIRHIRAIGAVYQDPGTSPRIVGVNWDVTADAKLSEALMRAKTQAEAKNLELETAKARIEHNALHDPLTGLPNRRYLDEALESHAHHAENQHTEVSILHIDLDRFKQINDTLGHAAGDAMLVHAAEILKSAVRPDDFVARIGGDEFVIMCVGRKSSSDLRQLSERIIGAMRQPVTYQGHECRFGVSIGIASGNCEAISPKQLLINADIALYRAKRRGRSRYEFFSEELQAEIVNTKRTADEILNGLETNAFIAHYQPQFDARTLDIVGFEALARWQHPTEGLLGPDHFLDIAEELNVVAVLDKLILEQAMAQRAEWARMGIAVPRISVNVSARRLADETLVDTLKALNIAPGTVSFELVESIYLDESDTLVSWTIDQIRELGIDIEIDDFGTGYASIVSLLQLQPNRLKIDRQLIMPITASQAQRGLVSSIIDIGASLGVEVVAEGVETLEHAHILKEMGCNILQGYVFARPMSGEDIAGFVRSNRWRKTG